MSLHITYIIFAVDNWLATTTTFKGHVACHLHRKMQKLIVLNAIFGMVMSKNIDNWGHAGGLLGGAAMAWAVGPDYTKFFVRL